MRLTITNLQCTVHLLLKGLVPSMYGPFSWFCVFRMHMSLYSLKLGMFAFSSILGHILPAKKLLPPHNSCLQASCDCSSLPHTEQWSLNLANPNTLQAGIYSRTSLTASFRAPFL